MPHMLTVDMRLFYNANQYFKLREAFNRTKQIKGGVLNS